MTALDLRSYVARSRAMVDSSPPASLQTTRSLLVEPLLETLGWDVRADSCVIDRTVDDVDLEYVPAVDSVPALLVAVEPFEDSLDESRATALRKAMTWTGIDRAIYTNGRDFLLLAGSSDIDYHALRLPELTDHESSLSHYSRTAAERRLEHHSRDHVARTLAVERAALCDAIVERLTDTTVQGEVYEREFASATDRFLDQLVVSFADESRELPDGKADIAVRFTESAIMESEGGTATGPSAEHRPDRPDSNDNEADESGSSAGSAAVPPSGRENNENNESEGNDSSERSGIDDGHSEDDDGEYVVRFFNDRGSIGAIGHSSSADALVQAAEYLFERGLSGVNVPWSPDDEPTVLNDEPSTAADASMVAPRQLSNGLYLETRGDAADRADRVEALASRAGLRAMVTGDWE